MDRVAKGLPSQHDLRTKWQKEFVSRLTLDLDRRSARLLGRVLKDDPSIYRWASARSVNVFAAIDRWLGLSTVKVMRVAAAVPSPGAELNPPNPTEHPLAALLTAPHALDDGGVTDALTGLVVCGVMTGRGESSLEVVLSNGIRKSMNDRALAWKAVLPKVRDETIQDLSGWLNVCRRHAVAASSSRDERQTVHLLEPVVRIGSILRSHRIRSAIASGVSITLTTTASRGSSSAANCDSSSPAFM